MRLHENEKLFQEAVKFTAQEMGLPAIYVEKDYWVTKALKLVFHSLYAEDVVFKGGTALAKCFKFIERFSEDIDLVVLRKEGETNNQMKGKLKAISTAVGLSMPEVKIDNLTRKFGMSRKTAHAYSKAFSGSYGHVRDCIVLETTWLGSPYPYTNQSVQSYIGETLQVHGQEEIAINFELAPFEVRVLEPGKTFCEKIMSLSRFSYETSPFLHLAMKIRHTYDLHQMLKNELLNKFFESTDFDVALLQVAHEDLISFKNNNSWLLNHPKDALIFKDLDHTWTELNGAYHSTFKALVYGEFPHEHEIINSLHRIRERLEKVEWNIKMASFQNKK